MEFKLSSLLTCSFVLVFMGRFYLADAASFNTPVGMVYANRTQEATFSWSYSISSGETLELLSCGYGYAGNQFQNLVQKRPSGTQVAANLPAEYQNRVKVYEANNVFGVTILNVNLADQRDFYCQLQYRSGQDLQPTLNSPVVKLSILDQPSFLSCLADTDYTIVEDHSLNISCSVYGNPVPTLTCNVLRIDGTLVRSFGQVKQNITQELVTNIKREFQSIVCVADGEAAGRTERVRRIIVLHKPTQPRNLRRTKSSTSTLDVSWDKPENEGGRSILDYYVEYGLNVNDLSSQNVSGNRLDTQLTGLTANRGYVIRVRARNEIGLGDPIEGNFETINFAGPGSGARSASNTTVIAIVVPIVVVVVLIIAITVGCYLKKKKAAPKNLPVSYVEEAVGYPASGKGLYANVDKQGKRGHAQDTESTSGYPDILHQTKERPVESNMNEVDYTPSGTARPYTPMKSANGSTGEYPREEEEMSPSYESSRKEYV